VYDAAFIGVAVLLLAAGWYVRRQLA